MPNNSYPNLPTVSEVITALCDRCLGEGQEVKVYKIDTNPDFTVQKSLDAPSVSVLKDYLQKYPVKTPVGFFRGSNFCPAHCALEPSGYKTWRNCFNN